MSDLAWQPAVVFLLWVFIVALCFGIALDLRTRERITKPTPGALPYSLRDMK